MNKRQAMRIALATEASYILFGASTDSITDQLNEADAKRFWTAQSEMAKAMLRRAGFEKPMLCHEIVAAVLGNTTAAKE